MDIRTVFILGSQAIEARLIGVGKSMATAAGFLQIGTNLKEENYGQAAINSTFIAGNMLIGAKLNGINIDIQSKLILTTGANLKINLVNRISNTIFDKRKEK